MADHLRMAREVEEPAPLVEAAELVAPDPEDHLRALHGPGRQPRVHQEVGRVVEDPLHGQLHDRRLAGVEVREDVIHEVRGVDHAVLPDEVERDGRQLPGGSAVPPRLHAEHALERFHPLVEGGALLVGLGRMRPVVPVAVVTDLVPGVADGARLVCVVLDHPAGDIKGRPNAFGTEEAEQARDADLRAVAALRHDSGRVGGLRVAREPQRLGVEIEGEHDGAARPLRPRRRRHTLRQGPLPTPCPHAREAGCPG